MLPNINYLFRAYNLITGNPMSIGPNEIDGGFGETIFKNECENGLSTDDLKYKIPDNVEVRVQSHCSNEASAITMKTESDVQSGLSALAHASGSKGAGLDKSKFTASMEYTRIVRKLASNKNAVIVTQAQCDAFVANIQSGTSPQVTSNFRKAVKDMVDKNDYTEFLDSFGTHYIHRITMGARLD